MARSMDLSVVLLGNRHASANPLNNLGVSPTELTRVAKVVTLSNVSGRTVPTTRVRFGEQGEELSTRLFLRNCEAVCSLLKENCQRVVSRIVLSARGAARRVRSWTVKAPRRHTDGGALYSFLTVGSRRADRRF